jgi:hypothetical protein
MGDMFALATEVSNSLLNTIERTEADYRGLRLTDIWSSCSWILLRSGRTTFHPYQLFL